MVVAPTSRQTGREPPWVKIIGHSSIGLPASGSVANVSLSYNLGPRVKRLLAHEGFDVVHVHEPFMPLLPFQFVRYSQATNIATFHAAREGGSRPYAYAKFIIQPWMKNIHGRIVRVVRVAADDLAALRRPFPGDPERRRVRVSSRRRRRCRSTWTASATSSTSGGSRSARGCRPSSTPTASSSRRRPTPD